MKLPKLKYENLWKANVGGFAFIFIAWEYEKRVLDIALFNFGISIHL